MMKSYGGAAKHAGTSWSEADVGECASCGLDLGSSQINVVDFYWG